MSSKNRLSSERTSLSIVLSKVSNAGIDRCTKKPIEKVVLFLRSLILRLTCMNSSVLLQVDGSPEASLADLALVIPEAGVNLLVNGEGILSRELLAAEFALVRFLVRVDGRSVVVQVRVLPEIAAAFFALERLLAWKVNKTKSHLDSLKGGRKDFFPTQPGKELFINY